MATKKKLLQAAAGSAGGAGLNVEDVFSTYLYTGNDTSQTITNGIDLSGEGGMTWLKTRNDTHSHYLFDTERGAGYYLNSDTTGAQAYHATAWVTAFNSDGFDIGYSVAINDDVNDHASWTFRKAPKFFDVVYSWTGDGTSSQTISHNLGSVPGAIFVKCTSTTDDWRVYHRSMGNTDMMALNSTGAAFSSVNHWNNTSPTSTEFTVGANANVSGRTYVAYLFAHNDGDGDFGSTADQDIIKCGSFTTDASENATVDLGWEPQFVIFKETTRATNWLLMDTMRGAPVGGVDARLEPDGSGAEVAGNDFFDPTPTGFIAKGQGNTKESIYIAIRRGPMAVPTAATDVFAVETRDGTAPAYDSGFPVDMAIRVNGKNALHNTNISARLTQKRLLLTDSTAAEQDGNEYMFDYMDGWNSNASADTNSISWMWKRAPNFCDVVAYTGNGSTQTISHNLGVAPEMIWVKNRTTAYNWSVYHADLGSSKYLELDGTAAAAAASTSYWQQIDPTESAFYVGNRSALNKSGDNLIAYLFASLDGVSKVGSYTGNGSSQTIDCGFSSGARFVMIKRTDDVSNWAVFDTERGIVSGIDPFLALNLTSAEFTSLDVVDPTSSGFIVNDVGTYFNESGGTYLFYAIA